MFSNSEAARATFGNEVDLEPGSLAARARGGREIGDGFVVTGRSGDGTVEALEDPSCPFVLGVLWHPEEDEKSQLI